MKPAAAFALILLFLSGLALHLQSQPTGSGPLQAVVVEDSAHRTPTIGAVICAPEVLAVVAEKKIAWHVVDQADAGPDLAEVQWALEAARQRSLPVLVLRTGNGRTKISALPSTPAALAKVLRAAAGG